MRIKYDIKRVWRGFLYSLIRFPHRGIRVWAMRSLGFHVGKDAYIGPNLRMAVGLADSDMQLYIGDRVTLALNDTLIFASRPAAENSSLRTYFPLSKRKIVIGDDTWIGANVVILPNITIGKYCVVGLALS